MENATQRYFIRMAFDGTRYHGWQQQTNAMTVQEEMNRRLTRMLREKIMVTGCGRTDAGVHAREYCAHFDTTLPLPDSPEQLTGRLNGFLPPDIALFSILPVRPDAHARFDAIARTYEYHVSLIKDPFLSRYAFLPGHIPDMETMNRAAAILPEYDDFSSFVKAGSQAENHLCHIEKARWEHEGHLMIFTITANRFLRNMVRAIVGTLLEIGSGKHEPAWIREVIERKDRCAAGESVPAGGLYLTHVVYPKEIFLQ
ncbi:MAG: tRNA pseudouridine(38-40) synthase TruA [Bacteroidales bacterium]|nr:tRNA pseudouridine(38-40) synthase TruA [Bacteroidales bacterium]